MKRAVLLLVLGSVLCAGTARAQAAASPPGEDVRLEYVRARGCPGERVLRGEIAATMGHDPFTRGGAHVLRVVIAWKKGSFVADSELRDASGLVTWSDPPLSDASCERLVVALGLAIAVAIEPVAAPPRVAPPAPAPAPVTPPSPLPPAEPPPAELPPPVSPRPKIRAGAGAALAFGSAPGPTGAFWIDLGARWPSVSISFEARVDLPVTGVVDRGAHERVSLAGASLVPCYHLRWFAGCGVVLVADVWGQTTNTYTPVGFSTVGHADLTVPSTCGPCTCAPPAGSCSLPATLTANDAPCEQLTASTGHQPFDPPSPWDGTCTTHDAVPAAVHPCGGAPCTASIAIAPLVLNETGCAPAVQLAPAGGPSPWTTFARACAAAVPTPCESESGVCLPSVSWSSWCIYHEGDVDCPGAFSPYSEKHVFYGSLDDTRSCTPCSCGAPVGSACKALVSVYSDTCATLLDATEITAAAPLCLDVPRRTTRISTSSWLPR